MAAVKHRLFWMLWLAILLSACSIFQADIPRKVALIAPFEGEYRAIGYDALYAGRLALAESQLLNVDLLAIDEGGQASTSRERVLALARDPHIVAVLWLGQFPFPSEVALAIPIYRLDLDPIQPDTSTFEAFRQRYLASDPFALEPTFNAYATYRTMQTALNALR